MAERRVLRMGNPLLRRVAAPVDAPGSAELEALVADLWDTMHARGGVGLAAPQIGVGLRVVVFGLDRHPRRAELEPVPRTALVNPVIVPLDSETEAGFEGCLSLPGMRGLVSRQRRIRYTGLDLQGNPVEREAEGFHARVVQHECDHLDGVLYPQRIADLASFGYEEELSLAGSFAGFQC